MTRVYVLEIDWTGAPDSVGNVGGYRYSYNLYTSKQAAAMDARRVLEVQAYTDVYLCSVYEVRLGAKDDNYQGHRVACFRNRKDKVGKWFVDTIDTECPATLAVWKDNDRNEMGLVEANMVYSLLNYYKKDVEKDVNF